MLQPMSNYYRLDSDYPCPYGYVTKQKEQLYVDFEQFKQFNKNRKPIAWMNSHCVTESRRENFVKKLQKFIKIDIYGTCGTLHCPKSEEVGCYQKLGRNYKFYLSLENSLCDGYMTQKLTNALYSSMVPIVYGNENYSDILPYPKSFINIENFPSVNSLADFLTHLVENDAAYFEYVKWQQYYNIHIRQGFAGFRVMCHAIQSG